MRRPTQPPRPATAWAHPYTGVDGLAVFYNDGGTPPAPAAPTPADLAGRPQAVPAIHVPPVNPADPEEEKVSFTQRRLNKMMSEEKEEGRRAAFRTIAEAAGLDPDSFEPTQFGNLFKQAEQARQAQLSEEQRRTEELTRREQELQARIDAAAQREADAAKRDRDTRIRAALVKLGATGDDLDDATALIRVADDADDAAISEAADKLKERRTELFGGTVHQALPPAPSGGPAAGGPPRPPTAGKDAVKDAARARAEAMGLRTAS
ncbi:hypothetical protein D0Z67_29110 (plasmid) [Streptomyces seoulensis]|uniref:Uncharacterized protein n=1 Tax=Streptomyces seoulensis TaxID=73044 RepID=A0A4P6U534_STRSO|nr:hypothetical protein [Streptomyces seoulensis]QBJ94432.1 hypothetical protein D0Z67_29110 [Streptomyces seoulensis]